MVFNSFPFIFIFLPLTLAGFFLLGRKGRPWAASGLTLASLVFYGWWDYRYLPLLLLSVSLNYWAGHRILQTAHAVTRKRWLILALSINLLLLAFFKYVDFFLQSINGVASQNFPLLHIIMPLGISFFSFTQIAFVVDAYYGKIQKISFFPYLAFATYFPYIVSGPILDYKEMAPQLTAPAADTAAVQCLSSKSENIARGLALFVCGLAKKILIADNLIPLVSPAFSDHNPQLIQVWLGLLAYSFQLYFDFSGYSDMAIGVSRMMGIDIPLNFNSPYKATSISDFWQRWHISLSRFLRNYLYIPLGGNRCGSFNRYRNLMLTMLLGGLWHGANWTFVVWGGLHGLYLCIQHGWQAIRPASTQKPSLLTRLSYRTLTLLAVLLAWCFFRAPNVSTALQVLAGMIGMNGISWPGDVEPFTLIVLAGSAFLAFFLPNSQEIFFTPLPVVPPTMPSQTNNPATAIVPLRWSANWQWGLATGIVFTLCVLNLNRIAGFIYVQF